METSVSHCGSYRMRFRGENPSTYGGSTLVVAVAVTVLVVVDIVLTVAVAVITTIAP